MEGALAFMTTPILALAICVTIRYHAAAATFTLRGLTTGRISAQ